jgi:hypothetical protein
VGPQKLEKQQDGASTLMPFEVPSPPPIAYAVTTSAAIVVQAPPAALQVVPPNELDSQIEGPMDSSPILHLAAPDFPPEVWPEGPGPLGF